jgi:hypothetical protein
MSETGVTRVLTVTKVVYADGRVEDHEDQRSFNGDPDLNRTRAEQMGQAVYSCVSAALGLDKSDD